MTKCKSLRTGIFLLLCCTILLGSCKRVAKEVGEDVIQKSSKKATKEMTATLGERLARNSDAILEAMTKNNPVMGKAFKKLKRSMRGELEDALVNDERLYRSLAPSRSTLDEFASFSENSTLAAKNVNVLKMFAKSKHSGSKMMDDIILEESNGALKFISKADNTVLGELRDGVMKISGTKSPLLSGELVPNSLYKISTERGETILCKVDDLGRVVNISAKGISSDEIEKCLIGNADFGPEIQKVIKEVKGRGEKIDFDCKFSHTDDLLEPQNVHVEMKNYGKTFIRRTVENSHVGRYIPVDVRKLADINPELDEYIKLLRRKGQRIDGNEFFKPDNLICEMQSNGKIRLSVKNSASVIEIDGDVIKAMPGSTLKNGQMNEFLNYFMPNKTYDIGDGAVIYKTGVVDGKPVVTSVEADYSKLAKLPQRGGRDSHVETLVRDGIPNTDGGHLVAWDVNGLNEAINQIPMSSSLNRGNEWKKIELQLSKSFDEGKTISTRQIISEDRKQVRYIAYIDGELAIDKVVTILE